MNANPDAKAMPCLLCERAVDIIDLTRPLTLKDIAVANFSEGVHCSTTGNYGSRILDLDGPLHFVLCDGCIIRHSRKMLYHDHEIMNARDYYEKWFDYVTELGADSSWGTVSKYFD